MKTSLIFAIALTLISFSVVYADVFDDFEDGNANGWTVVEGTWAISSPGAGGSNYCYGSSSMYSAAYHQDFSACVFDMEVDFLIDNGSIGNFDVEFNYQDDNNYYMVDLADPTSDDPNARIYRYFGGVWTVLVETPNVITAGQWEHVRIVRNCNNDILVYLPDYQSTPFMSVNDDNLTNESEIRFRFYAGGDIDNVDLQIPPTQISDDFEDGNADGWNVVEGTWAISSPGAGGSNYCYGSSSMYSAAYHQDFSACVFDMEVDFLIDNGSIGNFDVEFNYQDDNNYYMVDLADPTSDDPNARIYRYFGGVWTVLVETPNVITAGQWEHVRIVRNCDNDILVYLPDYQSTPILSATDNSLTNASEVRFRFYAGGDIDNVNINTTAVEEIPTIVIPEEFVLSPAYPNPFNPSTTLTFELKHPSNITLVVYDVLGREVTRLHDGWLQQGFYKTQFDGSDLSSGIYFVRLNAGDFTQTQKIVLLK